jgi:hypothetical protein
MTDLNNGLALTSGTLSERSGHDPADKTGSIGRK